jgi:hypothetical protein
VDNGVQFRERVMVGALRHRRGAAGIVTHR